MKYISEKNCLCCHSDQLEVVYVSMPQRIYTLNDKYEVKSEFVICKTCGFVFLNPRPEGRFFTEFYQNQYRVTGSNLGDRKIKKKKVKFDYIWNNINLNHCGRVFDIGAYDGTFLNFFKEKGWSVFGNELSQVGINYAADKYGINLFKMDLSKIDDDGFDLITIIQVLEHLDNPIDVLNNIRDKLKPSGLLFIEVPNLKYPKSDNLADFFNFQHLLYFEKVTLSSLLKRLNFKVLKTDIAPDNNSLRVISEKCDETVSLVESAYEQNLDYINIYSRVRKQIENSIIKRLEKYKDRDVVVWGAGQHTIQLFNLLRHNDIMPNIVLIGDNDPLKKGSVFEEYEINDIESFKSSKLPVIISSYAFKDVIYQQLKDNLGENSKLIVLY